MNKIRALVVLVFLGGFVAGIAFQKYIGLWQVRFSLTSMLPDTWGREKINRDSLSQSGLMVALAFGQSNAANYGETRHTAKYRVHNFYQGDLYHAEDPLLGANGSGGSVWTILADMLIEQGLFAEVVIAPIALGGSEISQWAPGGDLHPKLIATLIELQAANLPVTHLFWHQGEKDALLGTKKHVYKSQFNRIVKSIRELNVSAPIFVSVASRYKGKKGNDAIRTAQTELVDPSQQIFPGPDTDKIGEEHRHDGVHFSSTGLVMTAAMWSDSLMEYSAQAGSQTY